MAGIRFEKSEELLRSFVKLSEEHGAQVSTTLPYGEKWVVLTVEVCDEKPELTGDEPRPHPPADLKPMDFFEKRAP